MNPYQYSYQNKEVVINLEADQILEQTINWKDVNFPAIFPIFHYNQDELSSKSKKLLKYLKIAFVFLIVIQCINFLDTIISIAGEYYPSINILYVFFNFILLILFYSYTYYCAYTAFILREYNLRVRFYVTVIINIILHFAFSIINVSCFNGWIRIKLYAENGEVGAIICLVLGVLENAGYYVVIVFVILAFHYFYNNITPSENEICYDSETINEKDLENHNYNNNIINNKEIIGKGNVNNNEYCSNDNNSKENRESKQNGFFYFEKKENKNTSSIKESNSNQDKEELHVKQKSNSTTNFKANDFYKDTKKSKNIEITDNNELNELDDYNQNKKSNTHKKVASVISEFSKDSIISSMKIKNNSQKISKSTNNNNYQLDTINPQFNDASSYVENKIKNTTYNNDNNKDNNNREREEEGTDMYNYSNNIDYTNTNYKDLRMSGISMIEKNDNKEKKKSAFKESMVLNSSKNRTKKKYFSEMELEDNMNNTNPDHVGIDNNDIRNNILIKKGSNTLSVS